MVLTKIVITSIPMINMIPNGFDMNGIHKDTKTEYDSNGFGTDGNNQYTNDKYDHNGFDRNGLHKDTKTR